MRDRRVPGSFPHSAVHGSSRAGGWLAQSGAEAAAYPIHTGQRPGLAPARWTATRTSNFSDRAIQLLAQAVFL